MPLASGKGARGKGHVTTAPPSLYLRTLEGRAPLEAMTSLTQWPLLVAGPREDGHGVLVLPGLMASDGVGAWQSSVLNAVADRLAQPEGQWAPFQRHGIRRWIYGDTQGRR